MANAGRVEVNVVAVGEDKLSAMLGKVNAEMDKTKASVDRVASAQAKAGASVGSLADRVKDGIKPMNGFRELVNQVKENVGFLTGGVVGLGAAVLGLVTDFLSTEKQLDATAAAMFDAAKKSAGLTAELGRVVKSANEAATATKGFEVRVANLGAQIARLRGDTKMAEAFEQQARIAQTRGTIAAAEADLAKADQAANEALDKLTTSRARANDLRSQVAILQATIAKTEAESGTENTRLRERLAAASSDLLAVTVNTSLAESAFGTAAVAAGKLAEELVYLDELELAQAAEKPGKGGGGGGGGGRGGARPTPRVASPGAQILTTDLEVMAQLENAYAGLTVAAREFVDVNALFGDALKDSIAKGFRGVRDEAYEAADAIMRVSEALTDSMTAAFPDVGAGLGELIGVMQRYRDEMEKLDAAVAAGADASSAQQKATENLTGALISGGTAVAASVAKTLGGLRAEYVVRSAGEFAAGVATSFTNPAEAATHFSASVLYGIAAAKAGGGGGGGGGGGRGAGGGGTQRTSGTGQTQGSGGGSGTTIFQFSTLVTDRRQVVQAVGRIMARRDRSGYRQFEGA